VIFYDDRNVGGDHVETFVANSIDGGNSWDDFVVSDEAFAPASIFECQGSPCTDGYFTDYLGITSKNGIVYPVWTDNRSGQANTYVSPFVMGCLDEIVLQDVTVGIGESNEVTAVTNITAAGNGTFYHVLGDMVSGGHAEFTTGGNILLKPGFKVDAGGYFKAEIDVNVCLQSMISRQQDELQIGELSATITKTEALFSVFPNPTEGQFQVTIPDKSIGQSTKDQILIQDLMGRLIRKIRIDENKQTRLDLSGERFGFYLLSYYRDGKLLERKKLLYKAR